MKYLCLLACGLVMVGLPDRGASKGTTRFELSKLLMDQRSRGSCLSERELAQHLAAFSSPDSEPVSHREILLRYARSSQKCRAQIVSVLMRAMDKPGLNLQKDQGAFFLWHYGGEVLGELRASEALDLLIGNLGVTDGESPNMTHYPAVETIIRIGSIAIPKLREKIDHDENAGTKSLAVFCVAAIGGPTAKQVLAETLPKEKDKCLGEFMRFTLKSFGNARRPNHVAAEDSGKWFAAFYCLQK